MQMLRGRYAPHCGWLAILVVAFALVVAGTRDGRVAASYVNGIMANLLDPLIWLIALLPAIRIRRGPVLLLVLLALSTLVVALKLYMRSDTGSDWITGSILGNIVGFPTVGYIINAIAVSRRGARPPAASQA